MDDIRGDGIRLDFGHLDHCSGHVCLDSGERRDLPVVFRVGKSGGSTGHQPLDLVLVLRGASDPVRVLLRSHRGRHEASDTCDGGAQRRWAAERVTDEIQANQVEHHQHNANHQSVQLKTTRQHQTVRCPRYKRNT